MKVTLVPGRELGSDLVAAWTGLQAANPDLVSPYFHPEFTRIVAAARNDVEVAVLESEGGIVALLPFQREQESHGRPVGGIISDYHGLICAQHFRFSPVELLRALQTALVGFRSSHRSANKLRTFSLVD